MSEFQRAVGVDILREYQRLLAAQQSAHDAHDEEAIEAADHDMSHFLRMNAAGRMQEYMASRKASANHAQ
jgi:hypothetical protein